MSAKLISHGPFLALLLNTSNLQQRFLLRSLTTDQLKVVVEILMNLLLITEGLTAEQTAFIKKRKSFLRHFVRTKSLGYKKQYLKKHGAQALGVLNFFGDKIMELL